MLNNEGHRLMRVVVCAPGEEYFTAEDIAKHNIIEIADKETAKRQHKELCKVLTDFGCEVIDIGELPGHPNSVFTRDMAVSTPEGYIKLRMGIDTRLGEGKWMADALDKLNEPCAGEILEPGTVEGGDVIISNSTAFTGLTKRTNSEGIKQFTNITEKMDYKVRSVQLPDFYLHLDQTIGVLGSKRLMCCRNLFPPDFFKGFEVIDVPCIGYNVNFICLGENEILAPSSNTEVIKIAKDSGITVHEVDLSEFAKGAGGPNCLVMPLERL